MVLDVYSFYRMPQQTANIHVATLQWPPVTSLIPFTRQYLTLAHELIATVQRLELRLRHLHNRLTVVPMLHHNPHFSQRLDSLVLPFGLLHHLLQLLAKHVQLIVADVEHSNGGRTRLELVEDGAGEAAPLADRGLYGGHVEVCGLCRSEGGDQ